MGRVGAGGVGGGGGGAGREGGWRPAGEAMRGAGIVMGGTRAGGRAPTEGLGGGDARARRVCGVYRGDGLHVDGRVASGTACRRLGVSSCAGASGREKRRG